MSDPSKVLFAISLESLKQDPALLRPACDTKVLVYSHEHHAWWRAGGSGYTIQRDEAGVYTFAEAWTIAYHCDPSKGIEFEILASDPPPLPTIHPLRGSKAPPKGTKTGCECDYCQHWFPLIEHVMSELSPERQKLFQELVDEWMGTSDDLNLALAKLDGSWPGWEALKDFKPNQETA